MANYKVGDYIRLMRRSAHMSQEELAFRAGIATETISRAENGKHKITTNVYRKIMSAFECFPPQFYGICNYKEVEFINEKQSAEDLEAKFEFEKAIEYIEILKEKVDDNVINRQYILRAEMICNFYMQKISLDYLIRELEKALNLTVNNYEKIIYSEEVYPFTEQEALILMNIADAYGKLNKYERDEQIKRRLLFCLESGYTGGKSIRNLILTIKRNLAYTLMLQKRYEDALELLMVVLEEARVERNGTVLSVVLYDIAWNMRKINSISDKELYNVADVKDKMRQAYYIAAARNDIYVRETIEKSYKEKYSEKIDVSDVEKD